jgi:hypothetical protein
MTHQPFASFSQCSAASFQESQCFSRLRSRRSSTLMVMNCIETMHSSTPMHIISSMSVALFVVLALSACAGSEAMQWRPKPPPKCEVIYSEPQRDYKRCITHRQLEDMLRDI